jgi:hypothetical protein
MLHDFAPGITQYQIIWEVSWSVTPIDISRGLFFLWNLHLVVAVGQAKPIIVRHLPAFILV